MEKVLVKTGIYTFIITFLLFLVAIPRTRVTTDVTGMSSSEAYTYPEYLLMLARYSIIVVLIVVISLFLINKIKVKKPL